MNAFRSALALFACALLTATSAARAAETTYERLANPEPYNWLMHHHDYNAQRYSALDELWRINVGSGFNAAPMTSAVKGRQYIAIASGLCCDGRGAPLPRNSRGRVARSPELRMQGNATVVWVFGL
jgi:glucose dehydrogenase